MDAQLSRGRRAAVAVPLQSCVNRLRVEHVVGGATIRRERARRATSRQLLGEVGDLDEPLTAKDGRPFDDVLQLAHVARPGVCH